MGAAGTANNPTNFSGQYGSFTDAQFAQLQQTNPWLATVIAGAPEKITGANFGSLISGEQDVNNQTNPYAVQVAQSAREQALRDLQGKGYTIDPRDVPGALGNEMKPGETIAQYTQRTTGQLTPKDQAAAVAKQQDDDRKKVDAARADARYAVWEAQQAKANAVDPVTGKTHDEMSDIEKTISFEQAMGTPILDPTTGQPLGSSSTQVNSAYDKAAAQQMASLGIAVPPGATGSTSDIFDVMTAGGTQENPTGGPYFQADADLNSDPKQTGPFIDLQKFNKAIQKFQDTQKAAGGAQLTSGQINLLKLKWYKPSIGAVESASSGQAPT